MAVLDIINSRNAIVTLVSEDDIKVHTYIEANKAQTSIIPSIVIAQDLNICTNLGRTLYKKLLAEWVANSKIVDDLPDGTPGGTAPIISGDTTNYKELYQEIYKPLIWQTYTLALCTITIKPSEAGLLFRHTDNSESAGLEGLKKVTAEADAIARAYTEILVKYIASLTCTSEDIASDATTTGAASMGVFIPKKPWHGNNKNY